MSLLGLKLAGSRKRSKPSLVCGLHLILDRLAAMGARTCSAPLGVPWFHRVSGKPSRKG
jgi:hypothetical protein